MKPTMYNSTEISPLVKVSSRRDKKGNVFFYVEYDFDKVSAAQCPPYVRFSSMSSVLDFINSNF